MPSPSASLRAGFSELVPYLTTRPLDLRSGLMNAAPEGGGKVPDGGATARRYNHLMYHYDPNTALEELTEDATLPNPVHVRDMLLRKKLTADKSLEMNRLFVEYQKFFGETQKLGKEILRRLTS